MQPYNAGPYFICSSAPNQSLGNSLCTSRREKSDLKSWVLLSLWSLLQHSEEQKLVLSLSVRLLDQGDCKSLKWLSRTVATLLHCTISCMSTQQMSLLCASSFVSKTAFTWQSLCEQFTCVVLHLHKSCICNGQNVMHAPCFAHAHKLYM